MQVGTVQQSTVRPKYCVIVATQRETLQARYPHKAPAHTKHGLVVLCRFLASFRQLIHFWILAGH